MVEVKELGAESAVIGQASRVVSETEPQESDGLPICVYVCVFKGGGVQWKDAKVCPSNMLPCQQMKGCTEKISDP